MAWYLGQRDALFGVLAQHAQQEVPGPKQDKHKGVGSRSSKNPGKVIRESTYPPPGAHQDSHSRQCVMLGGTLQNPHCYLC